MTESLRIKKYRAKRKREGYVYLQLLVHKDDVKRIRQLAAQEENLRHFAATTPHPNGKK